MWWPFQWLFIYVLGGFTCIPVLIGLTIWWVMTYGSVPIGDDDPMKRAKLRAQRRHDAGAGAATQEETAGIEGTKRSFAGYLTVRRHFRPTPSNTSFLFGASTDLTGAEVKEEESDDGGSAGAIKDGKASAAAVASAPSVSQRLVGAYKQVRKTQAAPPKELFYCVLKGSVLFLYDDDKQTDCVAAISIEKYTVGMEKPEWVNGKETRGSKPFDGKDGEMFGKRNACVMRLVEKEKVELTSKGSKEKKEGLPVLAKGMGAVDADATQKEKEHHEEMENAPWFFFSTRNIEMEDLYISLLQVSSARPTINDVFSFAGMKQLVNTVDTEPDPLSTRWLNAFVGRIFLSLNQTSQIEDKIIDKIKLKLTKVQRPAWLGEIVIDEVHVGKTPPIFFRPMLKDLTPTGGAAMEVGLKYRTDPTDEDSGVRFIASTQAIIPLGYKQVTVNIMVEARLKTLEGNVLLRIKEPPSNRIWWGFTSAPKLEVEIRPVVQDRKLNLSVVLNQLDSLLRRVIAESIVLPAMDDLAFFDTSNLDIRGGIFSSASKYRRKPQAAEADAAVTEEPKGPGEVTTSHEDPSSATAETTGMRKRLPSKSQTMDHSLDKDEPVIGIARVDTAPASLDPGAGAQKRTSGLDKWFPVPSLAGSVEKAGPSSAPSSRPPSTVPAPAMSGASPAISLVIPNATASSSRDPSPPSKSQTPISIASSDRRASIDTLSAETASIASSSARTIGTAPSISTEGPSPSTSSAALLSAVKQFRAGDKKALQDITKTGMDGVKKGWMNFAAKRKVSAAIPAPSSPEPIKPAAYRPAEDERDAAAGIAYGKAMGHGAPGAEVRKSLDMHGKSLKERLDAAAHTTSLASGEHTGLGTSPTIGSVPMPVTANGRPRSGTDSSRTSATGATGSKPSLLSSPSKLSVPTLSPTSPASADSQWTPLSRSSADPSSSSNIFDKREKDERVARPSTDSVRSATGSISQQPVSVQPGMGRSMVVPRVMKRPGEVTGLGSSPGGLGMVRRVSEDGKEILSDFKDPAGSDKAALRKLEDPEAGGTRGPGKMEGQEKTTVPEPSGVADPRTSSRVEALGHSPLSHTGTENDLVSAIEADQAAPPVRQATVSDGPTAAVEGSAGDPPHPESSTTATGSDIASAIEADLAAPRVHPDDASRSSSAKDIPAPLQPPPAMGSGKAHAESTANAGEREEKVEAGDEGDHGAKKSGTTTPRSGAEEALRRLAQKDGV